MEIADLIDSIFLFDQNTNSQALSSSFRGNNAIGKASHSNTNFPDPWYGSIKRRFST